MSFIECASLAERHPDLAAAAQRISEQLQKVGPAEVIRANDLASYLELDPNQAKAVLEEFAQAGFLRVEDMVECAHCGVAALRSDYEQAYEDDGEYRCTCCDRPLGTSTMQAVITYRRGEKWPETSGGSEVVGHEGTSSPSIPANVALDEEGFYSYDRLAESYGIRSKDALRKRLDRYRKQHFDGGWKEVQDRRSRDARFLYRHNDVKHILTEMQASSKRPAK